MKAIVTHGGQQPTPNNFKKSSSEKGDTPKVGEYSHQANGTVTIENSEEKKEDDERSEVRSVQVEVEQCEMKDGEEETAPVTGSALPMRNRGLKLGYVAPSLKAGIPTACISKVELDKEALKWKTAIILYVIGNSSSITYLNNFLKTQCHIEGKPVIYFHNEGLFCD